MECEDERQRVLSLVLAVDGTMINDIDLAIANGKNLAQLDNTISALGEQYVAQCCESKPHHALRASLG